MIKQFVTIVLLATPALVMANCLDDPKLQQIKEREIAFQLYKNPPPFKHALESGQFKLQMQHVQPEEATICRVKMVVEIPEQDLKETSAAIDATPAKRIMLAMQGYEVPENTHLEALFTVDAKTLEIPKQQFTQTAELGRTRATIELIYATVANTRGSFSANSVNNKPWMEAFIKEQRQNCQDNPSSSEQFCSCRLSKLASYTSQEQMDTINYLQKNPYSQGSAPLEEYKALNAEISKQCEESLTTLQ